MPTRKQLEKTQSGLRFRVWSEDRSRPVATMGQTAKVFFTQRVGDSIIQTTNSNLPLYQMVMPPAPLMIDPMEIFMCGLRKGDSAEITAAKWTASLKVVDIFTGDSAVQADKLKEERQLKQTILQSTEPVIISWLQEHKILFKKIDTAIFLEIIKNGEGSLLQSQQELAIDFEIKNMKTGKLLNSTLDTSFHQPGPIKIQTGKGMLPMNMEKEILKHPTGSELLFYTPAVSIFGITPKMPDINPRDGLIFFIAIRK